MNPSVGETRESGARDGDSREPWWFGWSLPGIALLSLIPRLMLGLNQYVEYDGYWHVWIAQQDRWANFMREYQANAHPPLYFLLLRLSFWFGRTQLAYRSVSLISGAASVYVLGRTALKAMRSPVWAALAALAYGLALPSILLSNEVRTYMLSAFLVQVSFLYFLDLTGDEQPPTLRPRIMFGAMATLACLSEYYAAFYVGATMLIALALPVVRRQKKWLFALLRELATFALILALPIWEYLSHFGATSVSYDHLPGFYYNPDGAESAVDFLVRNLRNELNWFSPIQVPDGAPFYAVVGALLFGACGMFFLARRRSDFRNRAAIVSLLLPLAMLGAVMTAALIRAYPFGGFLRQQYVLFPFLAVCPFLLLDRLFDAAGRLSLIAAGVLAIGIVGLSVRNYEAWPKSSRLLMSDQMELYNRLFPSPAAVYIDQFNLTTFLTHHHNWKWEFVAPVPGMDWVDVYRLSRDGRSMLLFRDKNQWNLDLREQLLYTSMAKSIEAWHLPSMTIFCMTQTHPLGRTDAQVAAYRGRVAELSAAHGLCVQTLELRNFDVYAEFRPSGACAAK
jgi:hypothetical protein